MFEDKRVAIVHYWLVGMRGGERVLDALCELFPHADIFTHVYVPDKIDERIRKHRVITTDIQRLPFSARLYRNYLMFMPRALEQLDFSGYNIIISSESGPAKGVNVPTNTYHLCYCHTPMRYVWDMYNDYYKECGILAKFVMPRVAHELRKWDVLSSMRVDTYTANSFNVACRIDRHYRREATVVWPPVDIDSFYITKDVQDYYLYLGELVPYKRPDIAIEAFTRLGKKLVLIGDGRIRRKRCPPNLVFCGRVTDAEVRKYLTECRALVFPGEEDFGIVPVEAMASGRPVIAYRRGGALETVVEGVSGVFFDEQTPESLMEAVTTFEQKLSSFVPEEIRALTRKFSRQRFLKEMSSLIQEGYRKFCNRRRLQ